MTVSSAGTKETGIPIYLASDLASHWHPGGIDKCHRDLDAHIDWDAAEPFAVVDTSGVEPLDLPQHVKEEDVCWDPKCDDPKCDLLSPFAIPERDEIDDPRPGDLISFPGWRGNQGEGEGSTWPKEAYERNQWQA